MDLTQQVQAVLGAQTVRILELEAIVNQQNEVIKDLQSKLPKAEEISVTEILEEKKRK